MKNRVHFLFISGIALAILAPSCRRSEVPSPQGTIQISVIGTDTKALLSAADFQTSGTSVRVYDYLTGFTGEIDNISYNNGELIYLQDDAVCDGGAPAAWPFSSGNIWPWTRTGTHHFFGWLDKDYTGLTANAYGSASDRVRLRDDRSFIIPSITFTKDTPQFDLCYSDWVSVEAASRTSNSVELPMNHAFMALSVFVTNKSADHITVRNVQIGEGFKNAKSATLAYNAAGMVYANESHTDFLATTYDNAVLTQNKRLDLISGRQVSSTERPSNIILMWPQTAAEVENSRIHLEYTIDGILDPSNPGQPLVFSKDLDLKEANLKDSGDNALPMLAGHKYYVEIVFRDKEIKLVLQVLDWDMDYTDTSYSSSAIVAKSEAEMEGVLWLWNWNTTTASWDAGPRSRSITLTNGKVQGRFFIESPQEGEWQVDVYPASAAQYYKVEPMNGSIEDLVDGKVVFEVSPNTSLTPPSTQELHFNVNIRIGGEWRNANTEFNRKDWKLYLNP